MLSPYYIPKALRSFVDNDALIIEFKYIEIDEPRLLYPNGDGVTFELGGKTDRLYKITIDLATVRTEDLKRVISESLDSAIRSFVSRQTGNKKTMAKYDATISSLRDYALNLKADTQLPSFR
jgi:hypothetical protein